MGTGTMRDTRTTIGQTAMTLAHVLHRCLRARQMDLDYESSRARGYGMVQVPLRLQGDESDPDVVEGAMTELVRKLKDLGAAAIGPSPMRAPAGGARVSVAPDSQEAAEFAPLTVTSDYDVASDGPVYVASVSYWRE